jgi:integrase
LNVAILSAIVPTQGNTGRRPILLPTQGTRVTTMARALTTKFVENVKPGTTRREIPDGGCRGLYLVVQPSGRRAWAVRYRFGGKTRKLTLDGIAGLAEARLAAAAALRELELGDDPAVSKFDVEARAAKDAAARAADTVDNLAAQFIERHAKKRTRESSWRQTEHIFRDIVLPAWRGRVVHDIRRRDVIELIEAVAEDRPILANRVHAALSKFFNWLASRDAIVASPVAGVARPSKERARDRILSDDEIRLLWKAADAVGDPAGACVKVLLLTGQRRGEVAGMRRSEIDADLWTLPPERTKNAQRHLVPLSRQVTEMIDALPVIAGVDDQVFVGAGGRKLAGFSHVKTALDTQMKLNVPWVLHDVRRTVASGMARIGIKLPVIERVLNHKGESFAGIVGVYQRYDFSGEKRHALQLWADHVDAIVCGEPTEKVVRFGR